MVIEPMGTRPLARRSAVRRLLSKHSTVQQQLADLRELFEGFVRHESAVTRSLRRRLVETEDRLDAGDHAGVSRALRAFTASVVRAQHEYFTSHEVEVLLTSVERVSTIVLDDGDASETIVL